MNKIENKLWLDEYADEMQREINPDSYLSLLHYFDEQVARYSDNPAFVCMDKSISYAELNQYAKHLAAWLQKQGLVVGDRVAIMLPNVLQYPIAMMGILRAGLIVTNVNPLYTAHELGHQLNDSGAKAIIVLENFAHTLAQAIEVEAVDVAHILIAKIGDLQFAPKAILLDLLLKYATRTIPDYDLPSTHAFLTIIEDNHHHYVQPKVSANDTAFLQYTGGTTGVAKGAELSHRNMIANILQCTEYIRMIPLDDTEEGNSSPHHVVITALPLYHIFSLTVNGLTFMRFGAKNILIPNPRNVKSFVKTLAHYPFTFISGVNTLFNLLLESEKFDEIDFSALRCSLAGGMAVHVDTAKRWQAVTGCHIMQGYGLTETSPVVAVNPAHVKTFNGSVGLPLPSTEICVCDDGGQALDINEIGELWVRGPQVMRRYWQNPKATEHTFAAEGWLKTGDIVRVDDKGYIYIVDRKKHMIIVSGFNVYPNEVENDLSQHPDIKEVAVIGVGDDSATGSGQAVKAIVVLEATATLSAEEVIAFAKTLMTSYKAPDIVEFTGELPKTAVGKIDHKLLK
ncbi:MAG: AMP-binding protein [Ostreibacterium sp.]